jgi:hypothetical protein
LPYQVVIPTRQDALDGAAVKSFEDLRTHAHVISKLNDGVGIVPGRAVMSEQGVQEGAERASLPLPPGRGPS